MVTMGREKLGSATGGGGGIFFRQEECLTDSIAVEYWTLIFAMMNIVSLSPT